jgi:hypothetical protein
MKLKAIEDGMVVRCNTEDEVKELIEWAYECGYEWNECPEDRETYFDSYGMDTVYYFSEEKNRKIITYGFKKICSKKITEFSDLIIYPLTPDVELYPKAVPTSEYDGETIKVVKNRRKNPMSAEEILDWFYGTPAYEIDTVMGCNCSGSILQLMARYTTSEIISKIEAYEAKKKQEKESKIVWRFRTFSTHKMESEMFSEENAAIKWCEDMSREFPGSLNKYDKTCLLKEFLPDIKFSDMT